MSENFINDDTDLVTVTWHKSTGWAMSCPVLGINIDNITFNDIIDFLKAIELFLDAFQLEEGAE